MSAPSLGTPRLAGPLLSAPLPPPAARALRDGLESRGFLPEAIVQNYRFTGPEGRQVTSEALAFTDPVGRAPARHAGVIAFGAWDGEDPLALVPLLAGSAAPIQVIHHDGRFSLWGTGIRRDYLDRSSIVAIPLDPDIAYADLGGRLAAFGEDLTPGRLADVKAQRARFAHAAFAGIEAVQLNLWAIEATRGILVDRFGAAVHALRAGAPAPAPASEDDPLLQVAVQMLAATILGDTGVLGEGLRAAGTGAGLMPLLMAAQQHFHRYFQPEMVARAGHAAEDAYGLLRGLSYAGFVPEMLTELYRKAYPPEEVKALGRYDTPLDVTRRMWATLPVELLRPEERVAVDMTCGWGSFLIAGYERLTGLPDQLGEAIRDQLVGNDLTAGWLARLGLLISTSRDSWHVDQEDALRWSWLDSPAHPRPGIIVGNPPFGGNRKTGTGVSRDEDGVAHRSQLADRFLDRAVDRLAPGGLLAMILPQAFTIAQASAGARKRLLRACDVQEIWELPIGVFAAQAGTVALFARKAPPPRGTPVRVRALQPGDRSRFAAAPLAAPARAFTASALAPDQSAWDEKARPSEGSKNDHQIAYTTTLPWRTWASLGERELREVAVIFPGCIKGSERRRRRRSEGRAPKAMGWLTGVKNTMPRQLVLRYEQADEILYPDDLEEPRLTRGAILAGPKLLLASDPNPSWGQRTKVALDRKGYCVSDSFWVLVPTAAAAAGGITLEVLAALTGWLVGNGWIVEHLKYPKIRADTLRRLPIPRDLPPEVCEALTSAVRELEAVAAGDGHVESSPAWGRINNLLTAAYDLDDQTLFRLQAIAGWGAGSGPPFTSTSVPTRTVRGVVECVDGQSERLQLWLSGFEGTHSVPIDDEMPGWLLRPGATFVTTLPRQLVREGILPSGEAGTTLWGWGGFRPQDFAYLDEADLLAGVAGIAGARA